MWELIDTAQHDEFEVRFYAAPEQDSPDDYFDDDGETARLVADGLYQWFIARVAVFKAGVELGNAYLGACCYESPAQFLDSIYYRDMVAEAFAEARAQLVALNSI